jgi:hypothetical protein
LAALGALLLVLIALAAQGRADLSAVQVQGVALAMAPDDQARPLGQRFDSLAERLLEDETLRRRLSDDEYRLILEWALAKGEQTAERCGAAGPDPAECFSRSSGQLVDLLRLVDLTVGERTLVGPGVLLERLRLLEASVEPPLFEGQASLASRARLEALRADAGAWGPAADNLALLGRVVDALR